MSTYSLKMIEELTDGDREFMQEMVETFVEEIPSDLRAMNEAIDFENAALTHQVAHKIKPNLQLFGLQLDPEIDRLKSWPETDLPKSEIWSSTQKINETVSKAVEELQSDFNL